jgi:putative tryptophan/tyrosine transport system substrate-binding protein
VNAQLGGKCVELIREMLPSAHRVVALANAPDPFSKPFVEQIQAGGTAVGIVIDAKMLRSPEEIEAAFQDIEKERPDAIIVQPSLPAKRAAELAVKYRIPAISTLRPFAEQGGLMSYAAVEGYLYQRAAVYVDKILKGAKPHDLPVEQPTQFELITGLGHTVLPARARRRGDRIGFLPQCRSSLFGTERTSPDVCYPMAPLSDHCP